MKTIQKLYEKKSHMLMNIRRLDPNDYFKFIAQIRNRPNQYSISTERNIIRNIIYEPYKDPNVIEANRKHKLHLHNIYKEPALPKLNSEYLEIRELLRNNKDKYREIAERALSYENLKIQDRIFNQRSRFEENSFYRKIPKFKISKNRDFEEFRKTLRKSTKLRLPTINQHKEGKYEKLFHTEVNTTATHDAHDGPDNNDNEQSLENTVNMKDHKYIDISHQKQGHLNG